VGFEPTIPVLERAKTVHALDRAATAIGGRTDPSRWPRGALYPQKLALISPTSGGRSVGIVRSRTEATNLSVCGIVHVCNKPCPQAWDSSCLLCPPEQPVWGSVCGIWRMPLSPWISCVPERQIFGKAQSTMILCGRLPSQQQQARFTGFGSSIRVSASGTFLSHSANAYRMAIRLDSRSSTVTCCHVYVVTADGLWNSNQICWTILHTAYDYTSQFPVTYIH
jgi:hypothetical protein